MSEHNPPLLPEPSRTADEGGLKAPPDLGRLGKIWWWIHFVILVKLARLRFIAILAALGLLIVYWDTLVAHYEKWTRSAAADHAEERPRDHPVDSLRPRCARRARRR